MKPIEEGCLALVIKSTAGNEGKSVTVGKFLGYVPWYLDSDRWEVDRPMNCVYRGKIKDIKCYHLSENQLMRIDGEEFEKEHDLEHALNNAIAEIKRIKR